jgi:type I restriction enzyme S subunit
MLCPSYLRQFIGTGWFQEHLTKLTRGQGARRERLRPDMLAEMTVRMPSLFRQQRALVIHEKVQGLRLLAEPLSTEVDALLPALLHETFNGTLAAA